MSKDQIWNLFAFSILTDKTSFFSRLLGWKMTKFFHTFQDSTDTLYTAILLRLSFVFTAPHFDLKISFTVLQQYHSDKLW